MAPTRRRLRMRPRRESASSARRRRQCYPHANGGSLLRDLELPDFRDYFVEVEEPGATASEATRVLGGWLRDVMHARGGERRQLARGRRAPKWPPTRRRAP